HRHWLRRRVCAGRGESAGATHHDGAARDRRARDDHRRRDLHLHQREFDDRRAVMITLPERTTTGIDSLTPREIVAELDKYVVGQAKAKRAVAIALRNRLRRQKLPPDLA